MPDANGVHHEVKMVPSEYIGPVNVVDVDEKEREIDTNCIYLVNIVFGEWLRLLKYALTYYKPHSHSDLFA